MWHDYIQPDSTDDVLKLLADRGPRARIVAGATDLMLELERGVRKGVDTLIDVTRLQGLGDIRLGEGDIIHLGPLVTHNDCVASALIRDRAFPLARAAWEVGAPQIRNRGTIAGNLITASPANDTITPLMALGATVALASTQGVRRISLQDFYLGVRKTAMRPDEMLIEISFPALKETERGTFIKLALRRAQAISVVNVALIVAFANGDRVHNATITLGAVAPTIIRAPEAEAFLSDRRLDSPTILEAARLASGASIPIDDIRGSAAYRREMVRVLTKRALTAISRSTERDGFPETPILLRTTSSGPRGSGVFASSFHGANAPIQTTINGRRYDLSPAGSKSLLRLLREEAGLNGTKEGCAEGECGACTVFLDGQAVMACLVPAPRAHGADIVTIEGLAGNAGLHPVQDAFIRDGAVQCGYCTPGFVMAGAKLLEELPNPGRNEIEQALSGNLCRCTGYYKIIKAVEDASRVLA